MPPYLKDRHKQRRGFVLRLKIYGFIVLFFILIAGPAYAIFYSPVFRIKEIKTDFSGGEPMPALANDLGIFFATKSGIYSFLGFNNILSWKEGSARNDFLAKYPQIENIEINKNYFKRTVTLTVKERDKFGIWCLKEKCFWFDKNGIVFDEAPDTEGGIIRKVDDFSGRQIKKGDGILDARLSENLIKIFGVLESAGLPSSLKLDKIELQEITAVPVQQNLPEIYFSLRIDPSFGLSTLQKLGEKNLANISYIDLRVENRAYYK